MFSGGVYVGKHTCQATSVRAKASARSGLHPLSKMLAFLRSVSKFFDTLAGPPSIEDGGPAAPFCEKKVYICFQAKDI